MNHPALRPRLARWCDGACGTLATAAALAGTAVLAVADLILTIDVASSHGLLEANPLARALAEWSGAQGIVAWKLLTLTMGIWLLARCRKARIARGAALGVLLAHLWMMGQWERYIDTMYTDIPHAAAVAPDSPILMNL